MRVPREHHPARRLRPAAFLDRDGVLNVDDGFVFRPEALRLVPGAPEAVRRLNAAGHMVVVVTNQSGVARGLFDEAAMERFHEHLIAEFGRRGARFDAIYACPYHPEATVERYRRDHPDRKPRPGMILRALEDFPIDRSRSFLVGDKPTDIAAAAAAGIPGHLFPGADLDAFVAAILRRATRTVPVSHEAAQDADGGSDHRQPRGYGGRTVWRQENT